MESTKPNPNPDASAFDSSKLYLWVKGLESKVNNLLREIEVLKNNFSRKNQDLTREIKLLNEEMLTLKQEQEKMLEKMDLVVKELKRTAGIEEVMVLKKYVDLWNPLNFVTQRDLERAVDSRLALLKSGAVSEKTDKGITAKEKK
jgi:hypothetical protein